MNIKKRYPGGKAKAFNITYDDGVLQDVPFVAMLNKYGLKGTFNLNSQLMEEGFTWQHPCGMTIRRLSPADAQGLYDGHEIASHSLTHPYMSSLSEDAILRELGKDKENLEAIFGREVRGFAVPFHFYSETIAQCARQCGFEYARMSEFTENYAPCKEYYFWKTGWYHVIPGLEDYVDGFLDTDEELALCQIVGHSYDLDTEKLWETMENICRKIAAAPDIWPCTHLELVRYLKAMERAEIGQTCIRNRSDHPLWFSIDGKIQMLPSGAEYRFK